MRVISQWKDIDTDYESSTFLIVEDERDNGTQYDVVCIPQGPDVERLVMATYSNSDKARTALKGMSNNYVRYLVTDVDNHMTMTDAIDCELDTPFSKIEIKEMRATVYQFPMEKEI